MNAGSYCWIPKFYIFTSVCAENEWSELCSYSQGRFRLLSLVLSSCSCLSVCILQKYKYYFLKRTNCIFFCWFCIKHLFDGGPKHVSFYPFFVFQCGSICIQAACVTGEGGGYEAGCQGSMEGGSWAVGGISRDVPAGSSLSLWLVRMTHKIQLKKWKIRMPPASSRCPGELGVPPARTKIVAPVEGWMEFIYSHGWYIIEHVYYHILVWVREFVWQLLLSVVFEQDMGVRTVSFRGKFGRMSVAFDTLMSISMRLLRRHCVNTGDQYLITFLIPQQFFRKTCHKSGSAGNAGSA